MARLLSYENSGPEFKSVSSTMDLWALKFSLLITVLKIFVRAQKYKFSGLICSN